MSAITIDLRDDELARLKSIAARHGLSPEELVRVSIDDFLSRPDEAFEAAMQRVLEKNAELYRRLA